MSKALVRIHPKYRPISGDIIGFRLQACIPNTAGRRMVQTSDGIRATKEEVPAFRKPYLIEESMDFGSIGSISEQDVERFCKRLAWAGYTAYEPLRGEAIDPVRERVYQDFEILSQ